MVRWGRRLGLVLGTLSALVSQGARASQGASLRARYDAHSSIAWDYFSSDQSLDNQRGFFGATGRFSLRPRLGHRLRAYASGWLTDPGINRQAGAQAWLREAYLSKNWRGNQLRVGKQIVAWGQGEGVNPTDNLTPRNYTVLQPSTADQRFGTTSILWNHFMGRHFTLTTFVSPFFTPSVAPIPALPGVSFVANTPTRRWHNTEAAIKLRKTSGGGDWSISYFRGFNLLPNLVLAGSTTPVVDLGYNRMDVIGADFDRPVGSRYLVWGEFAYFRPLSVSYSLPQTQKPSIFAVLGGGRQFAGTVSVNLQVVDRVVQDYVAPQSAPTGPEQDVAVENALINGELHRNNYGATAQVVDSWLNQTLQGKCFVYVNVHPVNSLVRVTLTYTATDHIVETLGAEDYMGPVNSYFGQLRDNRMVFAQWRYNLF
ncbi:MAG: DUF1302 family protein [Acidiferrobacter sp.]